MLAIGWEGACAIPAPTASRAAAGRVETRRAQGALTLVLPADALPSLAALTSRRLSLPADAGQACGAWIISSAATGRPRRGGVAAADGRIPGFAAACGPGIGDAVVAPQRARRGPSGCRGRTDPVGPAGARPRGRSGGGPPPTDRFGRAGAAAAENVERRSPGGRQHHAAARLVFGAMPIPALCWRRWRGRAGIGPIDIVAVDGGRARGDGLGAVRGPATPRPRAAPRCCRPGPYAQRASERSGQPGRRTPPAAGRARHAAARPAHARDLADAGRHPPRGHGRLHRGARGRDEEGQRDPPRVGRTVPAAAVVPGGARHSSSTSPSRRPPSPAPPTPSSATASGWRSSPAQAWQALGGLDDTRFTGQRAELDFCLRALREGWRHLCTSVVSAAASAPAAATEHADTHGLGFMPLDRWHEILAAVAVIRDLES